MLRCRSAGRHAPAAVLGRGTQRHPDRTLVAVVAAANGVSDVIREVWRRFHRDRRGNAGIGLIRSEEHTSELQSLMRISYAVFCLKKKKQKKRLIQQTYI